MSPKTTVIPSKIIFLSSPLVRAISLFCALLVIIGVGIVAYRTQMDVEGSRALIVHTYEVREHLQDLQLDLTRAQASASDYLLSKDESQLVNFSQNTNRISETLKLIRIMTADNARQQARLDQLEQLFQQQLVSLGISSTPISADVNRVPQVSNLPKDVLQRQSQIDSIILVMLDEEDLLLQDRSRNWNRFFQHNLATLGLAFAVAIFLVGYNFRLLTLEVRHSKDMERMLRESSQSYRALSARILGLQDTERRKVARELHDSVGQYLAGLKINLDQFNSRRGNLPDGSAALMAEVLDLTDRAINEVRTISYLLHPPLLDELGFVSAARWYAEGFAKRSGIPIHLDIGEIVERLPKEIELALFRVLQESLTNVHRHAGATSMDITVRCVEKKVILTVQDNGKGIPPDVIKRFRAGVAAGVGLAGMRERIAELNGELEVESVSGSSMVRATLPTVICESNDKKALETTVGRLF